MWKICKNNKGVSNILGYLLTFAVASVIMITAVLITTNIIDDRVGEVARLQAQSLANRVADAVVEASAAGMSSSDAEYKKSLDIPLDIAGRDYYIEVTNNRVFVNTTDGLVSKSSPTYGVESLNLGASGGKTYCGAGRINVSIDKPDVVYSFDFGVGNISCHSPVESGCYLVSNEKSYGGVSDPNWWNDEYHTRVPIFIENDSPENLINVPFKIVLNPTNFDYSLVNVSLNSSDDVVKSDFVLYQYSNESYTDITVSPSNWDPSWFYNRQTDTINVTINELGGGYNISNIDEDTIVLNNQVYAQSWNPNTGKAAFNRKQAINSLENGDHFLDSSQYTVSISGYLKNEMGFSGSESISIANCHYVEPGGFYDTPIQDAIDAASNGDTIFVCKGIYNEYPDITKRINLIGEDKEETNIGKRDALVLSADEVNFEGFTIKSIIFPPGYGIYMQNRKHINITNCVITSCVTSIYIEDSSYVNISDCTIKQAYKDEHTIIGSGIELDSSHHCRITNCEIRHNDFKKNNGGIYIHAGSNNNSIIRCDIHDNGANIIDVDGIRIYNSNTKNNLIIDCNIYRNGVNKDKGDGVEIAFGANHNSVLNCNIHDNRRGILIFKSDYNVIENCEIHENKIKGIYIKGNTNDGVKSKYNRIRNCEIYNNNYAPTADGDGIYIRYSDNNTIADCNIYYNGDDGIDVAGYWDMGYYWSSNNFIANCTICDNGRSATVGGHGINFWLAAKTMGNGNNVSNCIIYNNTDNGISILGSKYNEIFKCSIFENEKYGINISRHKPKVGAKKYSKFNSIKHCSIYLNENAGVHIQEDFFYLLSWHGCYDNEIHENNFGENDVNNALDYSEHGTNNWNNNFWDDHDGSNEYEIPPNGGSTKQKDNDPHGPDWDDEAFPNPDVIIVKKIGGWATTSHYKPDSIQEGIDNVQPGGIVIVLPAEDQDGDPYQYKEKNLQIPSSKSINLIGVPESGMKVVIDPKDGGTAPIFRIEADYVNISGLTIKNGTVGIEIGAFVENIDIFNCNICYNNGPGIDFDQDNCYSHVRNCEIHHNTEHGISLRKAGENNITNCNIHHNTKHGIYLAGTLKENNITNCELHHNEKSGIYLDDYGNVTDCNIYENEEQGIYLAAAEENSVFNCTITGNHQNGIIMAQVSEDNKIEKCVIEDNQEHGILLEYSSVNNIITNSTVEDNTKAGVRIISDAPSSQPGSYNNYVTNCDISGNDYGIQIIKSGTKDNKDNLVTGCNIQDNTNEGIYITDSVDNLIYNNKFISNNGADPDAFDNTADGVNHWNGTYSEGGNLWKEYDEYSEGALDYFRGPDQDVSGGDSIADEPYTPAGGVNDSYPWCRRMSTLPYYIDYWNPYGYSVILVNTTIKAYNSTWIYMYCDYEGSGSHFYNHSLREVSVFYDDFNYENQDDLQDKWEKESDQSWPILDNGFITIDDARYIWTEGYDIPENAEPPAISNSKTVNESMCIVEAKMKINNGQGNMFFLADGVFESYHYSYMVSVNTTPTSELTLQKYYEIWGESAELDKDPSVHDLKNRWLRIKSCIYLSKTCYTTASTENRENVTSTNNYLYNYDTFAEEGNVSCVDTNIIRSGDPPEDPYMGKEGPWENAYIGLGAGLSTVENSNVTVDWIRVMKTPIVTPNVTVGPMESNQYGWGNTNDIVAEDKQTPETTPFKPGPSLRDFNTCNNRKTFKIAYLPQGDYTVTVTMGNYDDQCEPTNIEFFNYSNNIIKTLYIPQTQKSRFETKWCHFNWPGGELKIRFESPVEEGSWTVNSMVIERGTKGVRVGLI